MDIETKYTPDDDLWGIYTLGHVDKQAFLEDVRADDGANPDLELYWKATTRVH